LLNVLKPLFKIYNRGNRLAIFKLTVRDPLPVADLRFRVTCANAGCAPFVTANSTCAKSYRGNSDSRLLPTFKNTAAVTDLSAFADFESYAQAVSKETTGKYRRSANRATRAGYFTHPIATGAYGRSLFDIMLSKEVRSHGPMPRMSGGRTRPESDVATPFRPPSCCEHWRIEWGLFNHADKAMWGFASLLRSGNFVQLDHLMAHGSVLAEGGTKLLQFDVMDWLLSRADPCVVGLEYLLHGAIEDGGDGMANWRRYVYQRPHLLHLESPCRGELPSDFDAEAYLALNPDVRAAGTEPAKHYLRHGVAEGRAYRRDPD
jgi:hypothetical protein